MVSSKEGRWEEGEQRTGPQSRRDANALRNEKRGHANEKGKKRGFYSPSSEARQVGVFFVENKRESVCVCVYLVRPESNNERAGI
jgi:hypothetical protein